MKTHVKEDVGSFIGVQHLVTSASGNKKLRIRTEAVGNRFLIVPVRNRKNEYRLVRSTQEDALSVRGNTYPFFTYIPVKREIPYEGYASLFHVGEDYYVRPSTDMEIELYAKRSTSGSGRSARPEGTVYLCGYGQGVAISRDTRMYLNSTMYQKVHVVQKETDLYIEVWPTTEEKFEELPNLLGAQHLKINNPNANARFIPEYTYGRKLSETVASGNKFPLPVSFFRKLRPYKMEPMHVWTREDGAVVFEAHPLHCDICGAPINRYQGNGRVVCTCSKCHSDMNLLKKHIEAKMKKNPSTKLDYKALSAELSAFRDDLKALL